LLHTIIAQIGGQRSTRRACASDEDIDLGNGRVGVSKVTHVELMQVDVGEKERERERERERLDGDDDDG